MKVGDYVRTKYGIAKYISDKVTKYAMYYVVDKDIIICNVEGWENCVSGSNEIIKSSPNIIDLIEIGDYVNGMKIIDTSSQYYKLVTNLIDNNAKEGLKNVFINNEKDIKSIVTKEMFANAEYRVETN